MKDRIIVWFSCGAASAVAAKKTIALYGAEKDVVIVCCDTRASEHPDNVRFSVECEKWFGQAVVYIRNSAYETVDDVFERERYMSGIGGARCTTELKKLPRRAFAKPDDTHVFGFTFDESKRIREFESRNPELKCLWILADMGLKKIHCYQELFKAGIELPVMYRLGFDNNNCPGCVKAQSPWYWAMIRRHFPDVFKRRCEQSRTLGVRLVQLSHHNRIFLDELPDHEFAKDGRKENLSCGPECGIPGLLTR